MYVIAGTEHRCSVHRDARGRIAAGVIYGASTAVIVIDWTGKGTVRGEIVSHAAFITLVKDQTGWIAPIHRIATGVRIAIPTNWILAGGRARSCRVRRHEPSEAIEVIAIIRVVQAGDRIGPISAKGRTP